MKYILFLALVLLLVIPAGVIADPGDPYPGMMGYWQNNTGTYYGPGMMGYWPNGTGPYYGPGMMGYWQNGTGLYNGSGGYWQNGTGPYYAPGMMGYWQNTQGSPANCPCDEMMNGLGYTYNGGWMFLFMGLMAVLVVIFALVWTIAGILLIIWLYRKIQAK